MTKCCVLAALFYGGVMRERHVGRAIVGFLISFFMVCLLIGNGLLITLKTTIFRGSDVMDILKNANVFDTASQLFMNEIEADMAEEPMLKSAMEAIFSEELLTNVTSDVTQALVDGEEVDLTGVAQECLVAIESTSNEMIDQVFDEVAASGEISLEALLQNEQLQLYEQEFGREFTPIIEEYISSTYGDTTIKIDATELEKLKSETKATLKDELMPELEEVVDVYMAYVNKSVNQELQAMNDEYHITEIIRYVESTMNMILLFILIITILVILLMVAELLLVYRNAMDRGLRNIGVSAIIAGLVVAIVGAVTSVANSFLVGAIGIAGITQDVVVDILVNFMKANLNKLTVGFLLVAVVYFAGAIVCLVFSSRMYKAQKNLI